jgi:hypothetical protein
MQKKLKLLAYIILIVGTFSGTFSLIACFGNSDSFYAIIIFLSIALSTSILFNILYALAQILENQEKIIRYVKKDNKNPQIKNEIGSQDSSEWTCSSCGRSNPSRDIYCQNCGKQAPSPIDKLVKNISHNN